MHISQERERLSKINQAIRQTEEELDALQELQDVTPELMERDEEELKEAQVLRDHYYNIGDIGSAQEEEERIEALEHDMSVGEIAEPVLKDEISAVKVELDELKDVQREMSETDDVFETESSIDVGHEMNKNDVPKDGNVCDAIKNGSRRLPSALERIEKHAMNQKEAEEASPLRHRSKFI